MSLVPRPNASPAQSGEHASFRYEVFDTRSTTSVVKIHIPSGASISAVPGCMVATSDNILIKGKLKKKARAMFGPDDARHQTFTANEGDGWVLLAPSFYGSIQAVPVADGEEICIGDDAYLASVGDIESRATRQSTDKAFFSGHGLYVKKVKGNGVIFVCAVGSMLEMSIADGESAIVDTGHLVTWPAAVKYEIKKASKSWFSTGLSGEGMVSRITGPATVHIQSRNPEAFAEWIYETKIPQ